MLKFYFIILIISFLNLLISELIFDICEIVCYDFYVKKMVDKLISKYCRRHYKVVWYDVYCEIRSIEMDEHFYLLAQKNPGMSFNRVAFNTIKKFYSTNAINELRVKYGVER